MPARGIGGAKYLGPDPVRANENSGWGGQRCPVRFSGAMGRGRLGFMAIGRRGDAVHGVCERGLDITCLCDALDGESVS